MPGDVEASMYEVGEEATRCQQSHQRPMLIYFGLQGRRHSGNEEMECVFHHPFPGVAQDSAMEKKLATTTEKIRIHDKKV